MMLTFIWHSGNIGRYGKYHMAAFFIGFLLDLIFGDPYWFPHPVRLIGRLITGCEKMLRGVKMDGEEKKAGDNRNELWQGIGLVIMVLAGVATVTSVLVVMAYLAHPVLGAAVECFMTYQILAVKCLKVESMKVCQCLKKGNLEQAR